MKAVVVCSPYSAETRAGVGLNVLYARACLTDSLSRGEAPYASHLLYTQVLDDRDPVGRFQGAEAGLLWLGRADVVVLYVDRGISPGMKAEHRAANDCGIGVETRRLGAAWAKP